MVGQIPKTVYVASAWWRDSDPFVRVVATSAQRCENAIQDAMGEAALDAWEGMDDDGRTVHDYLDDIAWSGVHAEPYDSISFPEFREPETIDGLVNDGIAWLET